MEGSADPVHSANELRCNISNESAKEKGKVFK